jgi:hypothetical protein
MFKNTSSGTPTARTVPGSPFLAIPSYTIFHLGPSFCLNSGTSPPYLVYHSLPPHPPPHNHPSPSIHARSIFWISLLHPGPPFLHSPFNNMGCHNDESPTEVSPNVFPWTMRQLYISSIARCAPDRCVPTLDQIQAVDNHNSYLGFLWMPSRSPRKTKALLNQVCPPSYGGTSSMGRIVQGKMFT